MRYEVCDKRFILFSDFGDLNADGRTVGAIMGRNTDGRPYISPRSCYRLGSAPPDARVRARARALVATATATTTILSLLLLLLFWRQTAADEGSGRRETYIILYCNARVYNSILLRDLCSFSRGMFYVLYVYNITLYDLRMDVWWYKYNTTQRRTAKRLRSLSLTDRVVNLPQYNKPCLGDFINCSKHSLTRRVLVLEYA